DRIFAPRNVRFENRRGPRTDKDNSCAHIAVIGEKTHTMSILDFRAAIFDGDARLVEIVAVNRGKAGDFLLLRGDEFRPVKRRWGKRPAEPGRVREMVLEPARMDHEFLWHAAADHASPADAEFLRDHDPGAMRRRDAGRPHAAGSSTNHEEIDIVAGHSTPSPGRGHDRFVS